MDNCSFKALGPARVPPLKHPETASFQDKMRYAGACAAEVLQILELCIQPGVSTQMIDQWAHIWMTEIQGVESACLGYHGYPASTCISVNEVVCHGIPGPRLLKKGDIVNVDVTVRAHGVFGDTSKMYWVGGPESVSVRAKELCQTAQQALYAAIREVRPGLRLNSIGRCIENHVHQHRFTIVKDYCGHFIGEVFHALPNVLHYEADDGGFQLEAGMTFTIEPMVNAGTDRVRLLKDGWTVETRDKSLSAQYEHTVLVTQHGYEILTFRTEEVEFIARQSSVESPPLLPETEF